MATDHCSDRLSEGDDGEGEGSMVMAKRAGEAGSQVEAGPGKHSMTKAREAKPIPFNL